MKSSSSPEPAVAELEAGLKALYQGQWAEAQQRLAAVVEQDDLPELVPRARQWLAVARTKIAKPAPDAEDPYLHALYLKNQGDAPQALELLRKSGKHDERCLYLAAAIHASLAQTNDAIRKLGEAIEANPANRVHAFHDSDFAELRRHPELAPLFGLDS